MVKGWRVYVLAVSCAAVIYAATVQAAVVNKCVTLMSESGQTASTTGSVTGLLDFDLSQVEAQSFTGIATGTNNSGTTPTMDVVIQTCETLSASSCADTPIAFTQCTTGSCYGGDGERIDLNRDAVNVFPYFRAKTTLAGTNPNYNITVRLCYR